MKTNLHTFDNTPSVTKDTIDRYNIDLKKVQQGLEERQAHLRGEIALPVTKVPVAVPNDFVEDLDHRIATAYELWPVWFVPILMKEFRPFGLNMSSGILIKIMHIYGVFTDATGNIWIDVHPTPTSDGGQVDLSVKSRILINIANIVSVVELNISLDYYVFNKLLVKSGRNYDWSITPTGVPYNESVLKINSMISTVETSLQKTVGEGHIKALVIGTDAHFLQTFDNFEMIKTPSSTGPFVWGTLNEMMVIRPRKDMFFDSNKIICLFNCPNVDNLTWGDLDNIEATHINTITIVKEN